MRFIIFRLIHGLSTGLLGAEFQYSLQQSASRLSFEHIIVLA